MNFEGAYDTNQPQVKRFIRVTRVCHAYERHGLGLTLMCFVTKMHVHATQEMFVTCIASYS